jgi:hypothetical protein
MNVGPNPTVVPDIVLHRSRVFKPNAELCLWETRCHECHSRYLTDAGWYDAMGEGRSHYMKSLRDSLLLLVKAGEMPINTARLMLGLNPLSESQLRNVLVESAL